MSSTFSVSSVVADGWSGPRSGRRFAALTGGRTATPSLTGGTVQEFGSAREAEKMIAQFVAPDDHDAGVGALETLIARMVPPHRSPETRPCSR